MLYRKNITRPESLLRVVGGVAPSLQACGGCPHRPWAWHWPPRVLAAS